MSDLTKAINETLALMGDLAVGLEEATAQLRLFAEEHAMWLSQQPDTTGQWLAPHRIDFTSQKSRGAWSDTNDCLFACCTMVITSLTANSLSVDDAVVAGGKEKYKYGKLWQGQKALTRYGVKYQYHGEGYRAGPITADLLGDAIQRGQVPIILVDYFALKGDPTKRYPHFVTVGNARFRDGWGWGFEVLDPLPTTEEDGRYVVSEEDLMASMVASYGNQAYQGLVCFK